MRPNKPKITKTLALFMIIITLTGSLIACGDSTLSDYDTDPPSYSIPEYNDPPEMPDYDFEVPTYIPSFSPGTSSDDADDDEPARTVRYAASLESNKYHRLSCHYVDRIKSYNLVYYYTEDEAIDDGKKPCSVCSP